MSDQPLVKTATTIVNPMESQEDEINLLDLLLTLLKHKKLIILLPLLVGVLAAGYSATLKNIYRAEVVLAPAGEDNNKGGGALAGLGGLASLAGISVGGGGNAEQNLAVLKSREFILQFIRENKLMPILFEKQWDAQKNTWIESDPDKQPNEWAAFRAFLGVLVVETDKKTSMTTVAIEWTDQKIAAEWANKLVLALNHYLGQQAIARTTGNLEYLNNELMHTQIEDFRKTLFDLIAQEQKKAMLAKTQKDFAFRVLDHAIEPDKKIKPKRSLIVILASLVAFFVAVIWAFISEAMARAKTEPEQAERWKALREALRF